MKEEKAFFLPAQSLPVASSTLGGFPTMRADAAETKAHLPLLTVPLLLSVVFSRTQHGVCMQIAALGVKGVPQVEYLQH